jgi:hypothetical protein
MPSVPPDSSVEFTASDVLSTDAWSGKSPPTVVGIDVACTKISVDLQNLQRGSADATIQRSLQNLVNLTISDCAFLAFIGEDQKFGTVAVARRGMAHCQPEALSGDLLSEYPWLSTVWSICDSPSCATPARPAPPRPSKRGALPPCRSVRC